MVALRRRPDHRGVAGLPCAAGLTRPEGKARRGPDRNLLGLHPAPSSDPSAASSDPSATSSDPSSRAGETG
jgi:hypothetical protein